MPRPKGLGTESCADIAYLWVAFLFTLLVGVVAFVSYASAGVVNRGAKNDLYPGKKIHRICEIREADGIEIINRRSPDARIIRYQNGQATFYISILRSGYRVDRSNRRLSSGYNLRFPDADRLYIIIRSGRATVYPLFIVDGCVAQFSFQIPLRLHFAIAAQMKAQPT